MPGASAGNIGRDAREPGAATLTAPSLPPAHRDTHSRCAGGTSRSASVSAGARSVRVISRSSSACALRRCSAPSSRGGCGAAIDVRTPSASGVGEAMSTDPGSSFNWAVNLPIIRNSSFSFAKLPTSRLLFDSSRDSDSCSMMKAFARSSSVMRRARTFHAVTVP